MVEVNANDRRVQAEGKISDRAREYMLEVASCDEHLDEDGMCECCRVHLAQLAERDREITCLREDVERWKKRATECVGIGTIIMFEEEDAALDAARGEGG